MEDNQITKTDTAKDILYGIGMGLCVTIVFFVFIFNIVIVSGTSMTPTLSNGSIIITNHIKPNLEFGSIVVCDIDAMNEKIVKRIIGCPGDTIDFENGIVYRNGEALDEPYIKDLTHIQFDNATPLPITLDDDSYFLMGDNRNNSIDSREATIGAVASKNIKSSYLFTLIG